MTTRLIVLSLSVLLLQACASTGGRGNGADAAVANVNLAAAYLRQGNDDLAIDILQRALGQDSRNPDVHSTIAIAYDRQGHTELAEQHYLRATQLAPQNAAAANSYGVFLCRQSRWNEAQPYFRRAADTVNYSGEVALTNAGVCALQADVPQAAEQFLREALQRNPQFPDALSGMVDVSVRNQDFLRARGFMQRLADLQAPNATLLLTCYRIEVELNDRLAAERCASQLRERFPNSSEARSLRELQTRNGG
jgi:type IV pilus assembly protein PilF